MIELKTGDPLERAGLPFCFLGDFFWFRISNVKFRILRLGVILPSIQNSPFYCNSSLLSDGVLHFDFFFFYSIHPFQAFLSNHIWLKNDECVQNLDVSKQEFYSYINSITYIPEFSHAIKHIRNPKFEIRNSAYQAHVNNPLSLVNILFIKTRKKICKTC
jgi:hypothetical protein